MKRLDPSISRDRSHASRSLLPAASFAPGRGQEDFGFVESTADGIHLAPGAGDLTRGGRMARFDACDKRGAPGPMHHSPLLVKIQAEVAGMPTCFVPGRDATIVMAIRA